LNWKKVEGRGVPKKNQKSGEKTKPKKQKKNDSQETKKNRGTLPLRQGQRNQNRKSKHGGKNHFYSSKGYEPEEKKSKKKPHTG